MIILGKKEGKLRERSLFRYTFPSKADSAASACSFVSKVTKPYPAALPEALSKTTLAEIGLLFAEKNSLSWVDLTFHARLET